MAHRHMMVKELTDRVAGPPESGEVRARGHQSRDGVRADAAPTASPPVLPSRYQVKEELGRGGAGAVYRVYDRVAGHEVALKTLHGVPADVRLLLKAEFRALSDIVHPNLVDLHELVIEEQVCFFTMELVNGRDFASYVTALPRDGKAWQDRFQDVARQLALALNALHEGGKLHRDVKPSNVMVTDSGRVVLLDFGLALSSIRNTFPIPENVAGTPLYMAPEQLAGASLSPATDWYSFGLTLHEALTGRIPSRLELFGRGPSIKSQDLR
jgi:serine/threonine protein kinase